MIQRRYLTLTGVFFAASLLFISLFVWWHTNQTKEILPPSEQMQVAVGNSIIVLSEDNEGDAAVSVNLPWGSVMRLKWPFINEALSECKVTRTVLTSKGVPLSEPANVQIDPSGETQPSITHEPWGGIWGKPGEKDKVYVKYQFTIMGDASAEKRFEMIVESDFPTLENSNLTSLLRDHICQDSKCRLVLTKDIDGDNQSDELNICITDDGIPFVTVNGKVELCLKYVDPSSYEYAEIVSVDFDQDGYDEVLVFWNALSTFYIQYVYWDGGGWNEELWPKQDLAINGELQEGWILQLTLPNGVVFDCDATKIGELSTCFDSDGTPFYKKAKITSIMDSEWRIIENNGQTQILSHAILDVCAQANEGGVVQDHQQTFLKIPIYLIWKNCGFVLDYGKPMEFP